MAVSYTTLIEQVPWIATLVGITCLVLAAWLTNSVFKRLILRGIQRALSSTSYGRDEELKRHGVIQRLANVMPTMVIMGGITLIPGLPEAAVIIVKNVSTAFIVLTLALAISATLNIVNVIYCRRSDAHLRPIKGYLQLAKLVMFIITTVLIIAVLIDRSPLILLSGLGAIAAVLMLVFQDTLLSLVASVQISSSDMVRVGDWIEMPQLNADGDVIDIALHTVKVQNWDKTITTLPTRRLITDPFKNWRGMHESGGRRIKRSLYLDQNSICFLSDDEQERLGRFKLLEDYLSRKNQEISNWNSALGEKAKEMVNTRRITNIGTFRAYVEHYLRSHPGIHQNMTLLVRQLSPTPEGLPLEIYCFTSTTKWAEYESIQSDIFDHLLAILPEFMLQVFQNPSGTDVRGLLAQSPAQKILTN
ncbi:MAG: mechanosensitive ion channel family protein [Rickettsiaceae bacterium]|jgi:miniconductance mechanosensitive channel|nr:mechanosensitive ion channel family protein [Rickettsiaceae bacterium]